MRRGTVAGAVLCGGTSSRMGTDKALIDIDGVVMAERVAMAMEAAGCRPVAFVGGDGSALAATGREFFADRWPGAGPVGGVVTAMSALLDRHTGCESVVVCACDLPDISADTVRAVIGQGDAEPADVRVADSGRLEPMVACWNRSALHRIEQLFETGQTSVHRVLGELRVVRVAVDPETVRNVNRPDDVRRRRAHSIG